MPAARNRPPNPLPLPVSLASHQGVKREMISLYRQAKRGLVDPALLGRLALSLIAGLVRDVELEARIAKLEAAAARWNANEPLRGVRPPFRSSGLAPSAKRRTLAFGARNRK